MVYVRYMELLDGLNKHQLITAAGHHLVEDLKVRYKWTNWILLNW